MTARKPPLRVAQEGETTPAPKSVAQAAAGGDYRELLVALQERISVAVDKADCPPRDLAALTRRSQDIAKELAAMDARVKQEEAEGGVLDDEAWDSEAL